MGNALYHLVPQTESVWALRDAPFDIRRGARKCYIRRGARVATIFFICCDKKIKSTPW